MQGSDPFSEMTHNVEAVMTPFPNSGTASRIKAHAIPMIVGATIGGAMEGGGMLGHALTGAGALAADRVAGRLMMSAPVQRYLKNQAFSGGPGARDALLQAIRSGALSRNSLMSSSLEPQLQVQ